MSFERKDPENANRQMTPPVLPGKLQGKPLSNNLPENREAREAPDASFVKQSREALRTKQIQALQRDAIRKSIAFTQIVSLMMRSPLHKNCSLADLDWLVLPALSNGQVKIAEAKNDKISIPAGFLLWARVSADVDVRLSKSPDVPVKLKPEEWKSGDVLWVIETVGDPRAIRQLLKNFRDNHPGGCEAKVRTTDPNGGTSAVTLKELKLDTEVPDNPTSA